MNCRTARIWVSQSQVEGIKEMGSAGARQNQEYSGQQISRSKEKGVCEKEELFKRKRLELIFQSLISSSFTHTGSDSPQGGGARHVNFL